MCIHIYTYIYVYIYIGVWYVQACRKVILARFSWKRELEDVLLQWESVQCHGLVTPDETWNIDKDVWMFFKVMANLVINSLNIYQDIVDTFTKGFPNIQRNEKLYFRHSAKKCIKFPFDSRDHWTLVRCLMLLTTDRFKIWLIPPGMIRSRQYDESTIVSYNLPPYDRFFVLWIINCALSTPGFWHFWTHFIQLTKCTW